MHNIHPYKKARKFLKKIEKEISKITEKLGDYNEEDYQEFKENTNFMMGESKKGVYTPKDYQEIKKDISNKLENLEYLIIRKETDKLKKKYRKKYKSELKKGKDVLDMVESRTEDIVNTKWTPMVWDVLNFYHGYKMKPYIEWRFKELEKKVVEKIGDTEKNVYKRISKLEKEVLSQLDVTYLSKGKRVALGLSGAAPFLVTCYFLTKIIVDVVVNIKDLESSFWLLFWDAVGFLSLLLITFGIEHKASRGTFL